MILLVGLVGFNFVFFYFFMIFVWIAYSNMVFVDFCEYFFFMFCDKKYVLAIEFDFKILFLRFSYLTPNAAKLPTTKFVNAIFYLNVQKWPLHRGIRRTSGSPPRGSNDDHNNSSTPTNQVGGKNINNNKFYKYFFGHTNHFYLFISFFLLIYNFGFKTTNIFTLLLYSSINHHQLHTYFLQFVYAFILSIVYSH